MAAGDSTYKGLAVPLNGNFEIIADNTTYDFMTITGKTATGTGDYFVCRTSGGTEYFTVTNNGGLTLTGGEGASFASTLTITAGDAEAKVFKWFSTAGGTSVPTTGVTAKDLYFFMAANVVRMGYASDTNNVWSAKFTNN